MTRRLLPMILCFAALLFANTAGAAGFTPESPQVQTMVRAALVYLKGAKDTPYSRSLGGKCLVGLALVKAGEPGHKKVKEALDKCQAYCKSGPEKIAARGGESIVYSTGIAVIFLCSLENATKNPGLKYRTEIETLVKSFELRQRGHGGFGYPRKDVGDTSMTQYPVLAYWEALAVGVQPSRSSIKKVTNWLIRTQDPSGGFGYQAVDPGNYTPIAQPEVRLSLAVAGTGSLYICADMLGVTAGRGADSDGLPDALRIKPKKGTPGKVLAAEVDLKRLTKAKRKGNAWIGSNFEIDPAGFTHYYLYALERYYSFREKAEGVSKSLWYDKGVNYLRRSQESKGDERGSWKSKGRIVDTAFAVLFLLRSTQKSIKRLPPLKGGTLGGPSLLSNKIIADIDEQMKILAAGLKNKEDYKDAVTYGNQLLAITDRATLTAMAERFRRILASGEWQARMIAAEALGKTRDLDNVPTLIYGLTDPDWRVVVKARDSLRLISRRFDGFGIPEKEPGESINAQVPILRSINRWKTWYRSIRPDAEFIK